MDETSCTRRWWGYTVPYKPEVGSKKTFSVYIVNRGDKVIPKGTMASFWANKTTKAKCGETADADAEYKLPELKPYQAYELKATLPFSSDLIPNMVTNVHFFIDSMCTVWKESVEYQFIYETEVQPKNTDFARMATVVGVPNDYASGLLWPPAFEQFPVKPLGGTTYTAMITVQNIGGVKVEGLVAPKGSEQSFTTVLSDSKCTLGKKPGGVVFGFYELISVPSAYIGGLKTKDQLTYAIKTTPKAPKANKTMTVKVKFENKADTDAPIGNVAIWLKPAGDAPAITYGGWTEGKNCAYTGFAASADFSGVVLKAGKSNTVKLTDVPVPLMPGWYQVSAMPDINCTLPASREIRPIAAFATFEVVAP
ncbi:hypothetical protein Rsub_09333 [Raphidocelis subcapitata]|uniref:Uncharacterized protein n=1 Tax=Raphidocelis subcapitata TaxID=307507 RepID=A0A2V0PHA4_9CHLO|nr:hypothetical protein Rsub_09333 [Raphidocelis subcapitata]|eukprot:GBF96587.1 hypothetical protein Rsub_09333 [Raphidocelis subcapitata]